MCGGGKKARRRARREQQQRRSRQRRLEREQEEEDDDDEESEKSERPRSKSRQSNANERSRSQKSTKKKTDASSKTEKSSSRTKSPSVNVAPVRQSQMDGPVNSTISSDPLDSPVFTPNRTHSKPRSLKIVKNDKTAPRPDPSPSVKRRSGQELPSGQTVIRRQLPESMEERSVFRRSTRLPGDAASLEKLKAGVNPSSLKQLPIPPPSPPVSPPTDVIAESNKQQPAREPSLEEEPPDPSDQATTNGKPSPKEQNKGDKKKRP